MPLVREKRHNIQNIARVVATAINSTLSAFRTARPMFAHMSQLHACIPRVSEAAAVVLDLALCSQNSPLSTPTIRNWHRSCVLRDWNLRVRTDLHHKSPVRLSDTHHACVQMESVILTGTSAQTRGGGDCYTPAVGQVTIWRCKQTQAGLTESQLYTELHGLTVLYMLTDFHRVTVSICTSHDDSCSLQNL